MRKIDWWLVSPMFLLSILGAIVIRSVAPNLLNFQLLFMAASLLAFTIFSSIGHEILSSFIIPLYIISTISLITPFFFGLQTRGAHRWIQIAGVSLQPSEITKPFFLLTFAHLAKSQSKFRHLHLIGSLVLPGIIIFSQPDLGTTLVLFAGWLVVFSSQFSLKSTALLATVFLLLIPGSLLLLKPYQKDRLLTFVNPALDPLGKGYHIIQSIIAVGSGQIIGRGLGQGTQSQLRFLPEYHTDFIFASLSEELGFLGGIITLLLFSQLLRRMYQISQATKDPSQAVFCVGSFTMLAFQVFINIGMNIGLAPVTGITLPFISYGGSSLLSTAILLGIVNSISTAYNMPYGSRN